MGQIGVYSAYQLGLHNHLNDSMGGILNAYSRDGAYRELTPNVGITCSNPTEQMRNGDVVLTLIKEFRITAAGLDGFQKGQVSLTVQLKSGNPGDTVFCRHAINGVFVGAEQSDATGAYVVKTVTTAPGITLSVGDLIQVYVRDPAMVGAWVTTHAMFFSWRLPYFGDGTRNKLTAPLALTDADNPFTIVSQDPP